jgi:hypothetical protein
VYRPYSSSGQPAGPLRPPAPGPVLTVVKLMYVGAAVGSAGLMLILAMISPAASRAPSAGDSWAAASPRPS